MAEHDIVGGELQRFGGIRFAGAFDIQVAVNFARLWLGRLVRLQVQTHVEVFAVAGTLSGVGHQSALACLGS